MAWAASVDVLSTSIMNRLEELRSILAEVALIQKKVEISRLIAWCDERLAADSCDTSDAIKEWEADRLYSRDLLSDYRDDARVVIDSAYQALKTFVFVAAGMAGGFLAFLGSVWEKLSADSKPHAVDALTFLSFAVVLGAVAYGLAYLCHMVGFERKLYGFAHALRILTIVTVVVGFVLIGLGLSECREMLQDL
jgi:hypothetical protein